MLDFLLVFTSTPRKLPVNSELFRIRFHDTKNTFYNTAYVYFLLQNKCVSDLLIMNCLNTRTFEHRSSSFRFCMVKHHVIQT